MAASRDDPANALLEALACRRPLCTSCGLHPSSSSRAGAVRSAEEVPDALTSLAADLDGSLAIPSLASSVADLPRVLGS